MLVSALLWTIVSVAVTVADSAQQGTPRKARRVQAPQPAPPPPAVDYKKAGIAGATAAAGLTYAYGSQRQNIALLKQAAKLRDTQEAKTAALVEMHRGQMEALRDEIRQLQQEIYDHQAQLRQVNNLKDRLKMALEQKEALEVRNLNLSNNAIYWQSQLKVAEGLASSKWFQLLESNTKLDPSASKLFDLCVRAVELDLEEQQAKTIQSSQTSSSTASSSRPIAKGKAPIKN